MQLFVPHCINAGYTFNWPLPRPAPLANRRWQDGMMAQGFFVLLLAMALILLPPRGFAQDELSSAELLQAQNPAWFDDELERLRSIANRLQMQSAVQVLDQWRIVPRNDSTVLFSPQPLLSEADGDPRWQSFARALNAARRRLADEVFEAAKRAAAGGRESDAFRLLWRVLRENPEHKQAARLLGPFTNGLDVLPRVMYGRSLDRLFGWRDRSYRIAYTPHFKVTSRADVDRTRETAAWLEQFFVLWLQEFYPLWAKPGVLARCITEGKPVPYRHERVEVYLFADREEYLTALGLAERNIAISVGYYNPEHRKSFFYPEKDKEIDATIYHELTHQLLAELAADGSGEPPGMHRDIWLVEGIALYMEALRPDRTVWRVGGVDATRVQTARYRAVRDGFWPPWETFHTAGAEDWKASPEVALLYTHALGLTHVFLDLLGPQGREAYFHHLQRTYRGAGDDAAGLLGLLGAGEADAKKRYQDLMILDDHRIEQLRRAGARPQDFVLSGSILRPESWEAVGELAKECHWLELSFSNVRDEDLRWLSGCKQLRRLSLEGTQITERSVQMAAALPQLQELDLTGCPIGDDAVTHLAGHPALTTLWLGETSITEAALGPLRQIPNLQRCDLSGAQVPAEAAERFREWLEERSQDN